MRCRQFVLALCLTLTASIASGEIDRRFKPKLPAGARVTTVFEQSDGRLLVAGIITSAPANKALPAPFLVRLRANGPLDRTFRPQQRGNLNFLGINEITERADGIGIIGTFQVGNEDQWRNAIVLERNGKLTSYTPAANFEKGTWLPDGGIAFEGFNHSETYGRIGLLDSTGAGPTYVDTPYPQSQFVWLRGMADGDVIGYLFRPPVPPGEPRQLIYSMRNGGREWRPGHDPIPALGPSNSLYMATDFLILWRGTGPFHYQLPAAIFERLPRTIPCLAPQSDGSVVYSVRYTVHGTNFIFRCTSDGSNDETFPRLFPNGPVNGLLALRNSQILAWGDFTEINGIPVPNLVRLSARQSSE